MFQTSMYTMRCVQKISSHGLWKIEAFIEEDTRNIAHRTMMPQSPPKQVPWDLTQFCQSQLAAPLNFPESHWCCEISSLSKVILVLGKARSHRVPNLGCRGAESRGWFDISPKNCMRRDLWVGALSWWSCQSPVAHSCGLANHLNSFRGGIFTLNTILKKI